MEPQKRKYQKQKTEGQITVKHFLNTRLKGKKQDDGQIAYPLYVRIMVKAQQSDIKSRLNVLCQPHQFDQFKKEQSSLLNQEVNALIGIIKNLKPFDNQEFTLQQALAVYGDFIKPLNTIIEGLLKAEIKYCIIKNSPDLPKDIDINSKGQLEALTFENDLIQLINWQQPAHAIVDRLQTVVSDSNLASALAELNNTYQKAFNFGSMYNTLNAIHQYLAPPSLDDWYNGNLQTDMRSYYSNSEPTIATINLLIDNHLK